jgi:hypothetical protein
MTQSPTLTGARVLAGDNPFSVDPTTEGFAAPPAGLELWSETFFFVAFSEEHQVGVWVHCGRERDDKSLWWVHTLAFLPGGVVLADRSFTRLQDGDGNLRVTCVEPLKRWRVTFDGAGEVTSTDDLAAGPLGMGVAVPFRFELDFDAVAPVYDMHRAMTGDLDWGMGGLHHEQGHRVTGSVTAQGTTWQIDGPGLRDHSSGERDFSDFGGHAWNMVAWPKTGRVLCTFAMWRRDNPAQAAVSLVVLMENGTTEITRDFDITGKTAPGGIPHDLELDFFRADGAPVHLTGEVIHNATVTYAEPNHNLIGNHADARHGFSDPIVADESIVRWTWPDGEIGIANYERGVRLTHLPLPWIPLPAESPFRSTRETGK